MWSIVKLTTQVLLAALTLICCERSAADSINPPRLVVKVDPVSGLTTTTIVFDCSETQPGARNGKLYYRWDWNNDGFWDTEYSAGPIIKHRFLSRGIHLPVAEVLNSSGLTDTSRLTISINQGYSPPKACFSVLPEYGNRLTEFVFDATDTRDDEDAPGSFQFRWDWEGDGRWDSGYKASPIARHTYFETGIYLPLMEVKDPSGLLGQFQKKLEVTQTDPGLCADFSWTPVHPLPGDTVVFDAGLSSNLRNPADPLLYYWKFEKGESLKSSIWLGPFHEPTIATTFSTGIKYLVTLKIVNGLGLENQSERYVRIYQENRPPLPQFRISTYYGNLTTQFFLNAGATGDAEDRQSALQVRWDFEGDGRWDTEYSSDKVVNHRFDRQGIYRIILEAMDTKGSTDTTSVFVTVTPGTNETGLIIVRRNGREEYYPTVKIGNQWWTGMNIYFEPLQDTGTVDSLSAVCYARNCLKWGRLYTIYSATSMNLKERAQGICPDGWHIPSKGEWESLISFIGGYSAADELLPGGSADFNALYPGWGEEVMNNESGNSIKNWKFKDFGAGAYFWSSTALTGNGMGSHWNLTLNTGTGQISEGYSGNNNFMSVRCVKDE